jgi:hypothetical protein
MDTQAQPRVEPVENFNDDPGCAEVPRVDAHMVDLQDSSTLEEPVRGAVAHGGGAASE